MKRFNLNNDDQSVLWPGPGHFILPGPVGLVYADVRLGPERSVSRKGSSEGLSVWDDLSRN